MQWWHDFIPLSNSAEESRAYAEYRARWHLADLPTVDSIHELEEEEGEDQTVIPSAVQRLLDAEIHEPQVDFFKLYLSVC
jgi:hypothetical protein